MIMLAIMNVKDVKIITNRNKTFLTMKKDISKTLPINSEVIAALCVYFVQTGRLELPIEWKDYIEPVIEAGRIKIPDGKKFIQTFGNKKIVLEYVESEMSDDYYSNEAGT